MIPVERNQFGRGWQRYQDQSTDGVKLREMIRTLQACNFLFSAKRLNKEHPDIWREQLT